MDLRIEEIETMDAPESWYIIVGDILIIVAAAVAIT